MAFCRLVFPLLVLSVICINASSVPLYMWGDRTSIKSSPLTTLSTPEFQGILKQELADDTLTIVFIEETLSVEDFSRKNEGETAFPYLRKNVGNSIYLPSVENALRTLNEIADPSKSDHITLTDNGLTEEIAPKSDESGRFVFINLRDAKEGETRVEMLQRHDAFMQDVMTRTLGEIKNPEKVVAIYTAHYPSWVVPVTHTRSRRAVTVRSDNQTLFVMDSLRLYSSQITVTAGNDSYILDGFTSATTQSDEANATISTKMNFSKAAVTLTFNQKGGYWFFENVTLEQPSLPQEDLYPVEEVFAILGFSYRCMETVRFSSRNETKMYTLTFKDMKIQPFVNSSAPFGDSFNCVGFFSAPIWAGLFVVFILLAITFYGIMMMMDIRTMDRFDDPKGKTITINAAE